MASKISQLVGKQISRGYNVSQTNPVFQTIFNECNNVVEVDIPIKLENGTHENIVGYRAQHNNILGPYKSPSNNPTFKPESLSFLAIR